jgi:hypothetical protein
MTAHVEGRQFRTRNTTGFVQRLDAQMIRRGIYRTTGYFHHDSSLIASATVIDN